jgi:SAM-dependent methyltransferase
MNPKAMEPYGKALAAYHEGHTNAQLIIRRDDGLETPIPVGIFFREPSEFTPIEKAALDSCKGRVLDVGAGTGSPSLALQRRGISVTVIDINPHAVNIMNKRGLKDVRCADIFEFSEGNFDTLLMLGHGIGMVETIAGLDRFLKSAHGLRSDDGQLLLDSLDVRTTSDPNHLAYHETKRQEGRYIGEIRMQFEFGNEKGPYCGWLQVDPETLKDHAHLTGWRCEVVHQEASGDYLAQLKKR